MFTKTAQTITAVLVLLVATSQLAAQTPKLIYSNVWDQAEYQYGIGMRDTGGEERPLVLDTEGRFGATGEAISRPIYVQAGGIEYLYWWDDRSDDLYRGHDANGNGVIDMAEIQPVWNNSVYVGGAITTMSVLTLRHQNGRFLLTDKTDGGSPSTNGAVLLDDLNGDGDFLDAGETQEVINGGNGHRGSGSVYGSTIVVDGVVVSSDSVEAADFMPDGDIIFWDHRDDVWVRKDLSTGDVSLFLNYGSDHGNAASQLPVNPFFLDPANPQPDRFRDLDKVHVDAATGELFLAVSYTTAGPWIFRAQDLDGNGDIMAANEVAAFWTGANAPFPAAILAFDRFGSSIYAAVRETDNLSGAVHIIRLEDGNADGDADDAGELTVIRSWPAGDAARIMGLTAVPSGAFGGSCIECSIDDSGIGTSAGTLTFTFDDLPASFQNGDSYGVVLLSLTGDGNLPVTGGCSIGLTVDATTTAVANSFLGFFTTAAITDVSATTAGAPYPFGVPYTAPPIHYAGIVFDAATGNVIGTPSKLTNEGSILVP